MISPAAANKLAIQTQPSSTATAGVPFATQPVIYEEDQYGNVETGDNSTVVTAALATGTGPLQGTKTATVVGGIATFTNLADNTAETITLKFTSPNLTSATSGNIAISPAAAKKLVIQTQPSSTATAGVPFATQPVIYEEDQYGNVETGDNSTVVTVALATGTGPLQGTKTATVVGGIATFTNLADNTAETISLNFASPGLTSATSNNIVVTSGNTTTTIFGNTFTGNASYNGGGAVEVGVKFESSTAGYINGVRFYKGAGNTGTHVGYLWSSTGTLLASATFSGETGSGWQQVNFATPVAISANTIYIASYFSPTGYFAYSNNYFTSAVTNAPLTAPASSSVGGNGVYAYTNNPSAAFPHTTYQASNYWVDVTFSTGSVSTPTKLVVQTQPSATGTAGVAFATQPVIYEEDQNGNLETGDNSTVVTVALASGAGPLQGTLTATVVGGIATFTNLADNTAETITLKFTSPNLTSATSGNVVISPAAANKLAIQTQPSSTATAGVPFATQPVIYEEDQYGNVETGDNSTVVTAALATGTGPLQGTKTATVVGGIATFTNLADNTAETITLKFTSPNLTSATSGNIAISPAAAKKLVIQTQPSSTATAGVPFATQPVIYEEDQYGNVETGDNSTVVTVALATGTGPLQGTKTATVVGGIATFTNLADNTAETISLNFASPGLTSATSNNIVVTSGNTTTTIFGNTFTGNASYNGGGAVEVGVKFESSTAGYINGVRFYKGAGNTGTHVGYLWSSTGTLLASATFSGETGSGWQQVNFATPVAISANTIYIASYFSPTGYFAYSNNYFTSAVTNAPLTAPASSSVGGNGVYAYTNNPSAAFPHTTYQASNYWVDVVYSTSSSSSSQAGDGSGAPSVIALGLSTVPTSQGSDGKVTVGARAASANTGGSAIGALDAILAAWTSSDSSSNLIAKSKKGQGLGDVRYTPSDDR